jgi:hypothetical protein
MQLAVEFGIVHQALSLTLWLPDNVRLLVGYPSVPELDGCNDLISWMVPWSSTPHHPGLAGWGVIRLGLVSADATQSITTDQTCT